MKFLRLVFVAAMAALAQGCISFDMGPERRFQDSEEKCQLTVRSLKRVVPRIKLLQHDSSGSTYKLELVGEGEFIRHDGHRMMVGKPCLSVGLWPGLSDSKNKGELFIFSILGIYPFCGLPTLFSLVFEPFRDYRQKPEHGVGDAADVGIIGFNKYYRDVRKDPGGDFVTASTERVPSYSLFAYGVVIDGVRYDDADNNGNNDGIVYFRSSRPRGSRIAIRIVDPPAWRDDSGDGFSDLTGMVVNATLP